MPKPTPVRGPWPLMLMRPVPELILMVPPPAVRIPPWMSVCETEASAKPTTSMRPPVVMRLPVLDAAADSNTPSFKLVDPRNSNEPAPALSVKLPVVLMPAAPTPRA